MKGLRRSIIEMAFDLGADHLVVLALLSDHVPCATKDVAAAVDRPQRAVKSILDRLARDRHVERDADLRWMITDNGVRVMEVLVAHQVIERAHFHEGDPCDLSAMERDMLALMNDEKARTIPDMAKLLHRPHGEIWECALRLSGYLAYRNGDWMITHAGLRAARTLAKG